MALTIDHIAESGKDTGYRLTGIMPKDRKAADNRMLSCTITVDTASEHQTFLGFGGAITESSGYVLSQLPEEERESVLASYFSPDATAGNCYEIARTHLNSCDFSLENWACVTKKDETLGSFSMERPDRFITPYLQLAQKAKGGTLPLMVSPWSPPVWMKDNGEMNHGGHLLPQYRPLWAKYVSRYLAELKSRGLTTQFVSVQNEPAASQPWDSCLWSATDEAEFAVQDLGPELKRAGFGDTGILVWDHNRDLLAERFAQSMAVPGADQYIAGAAYHWYSGDQYQNVAQVAQQWPKKQLVFSEGCVEGGPRDGAWFTGERYAHNIINDLNSGCTAWIDWNIALNLDGGPNHAGNMCDSPVLVDVIHGTVRYQSSFYAIGHFSRYIRKGAKRLGVTRQGYMTPATVDGCMGNTMEATAFRNTDASIAVVVTNRTEAPMLYALDVGSEQHKLMMPPRSMQTVLLR